MAILPNFLKKTYHIPKDSGTHVPSVRESMWLWHYTLPKERTAIIILIGLFVLGTCSFVIGLSRASSTSTPQDGGVMREGIIGTPRFINPVLAVSDIDRDLAALIHRGLMRPSGDKLALDLAESYTVSPDGLVYSFVLSEAYFHDGMPVTVDDVIYTLRVIQDPEIKSPRKSNWDGVTIERADDKTVRFRLKSPYAPFIENMSIGILPKHLWKDVAPAEFALSPLNMESVGAGPFKITDINKDAKGIPTTIELTSWNKFTPRRAFIDKIMIHLYNDESKALEDWKSGAIDSLSGISVEGTSDIDKTRIHTALLPRTFGIFFNLLSKSSASDQTVRNALDLATPKKDIINVALGGYADNISGPYPIISEKVRDQDIKLAEEMLDKAGWKRAASGIREKNGKPLTITLTTTPNPELKKTASIIKDAWHMIGVDTTVLVYELSDLNTTVIHQRNFEALLFGLAFGATPDLYAFWHSSQKEAPGLNITGYTNKEIDKILEDARASVDAQSSQSTHNKVSNALEIDQPAVFLYAPSYIYLPAKSVKNINFDRVTFPADRFYEVTSWYIRTKNVWNIFIDNN